MDRIQKYIGPVTFYDSVSFFVFFKPQRWQESGSLGLPGNDRVGLFPPLRRGSPEPLLFGIWVSRGFLRLSPTGYGKLPPLCPPSARAPYTVSYTHLTLPTSDLV